MSPRTHRQATPLLAAVGLVAAVGLAASTASAASLQVTSRQLSPGQGGTRPSPPPPTDTTRPTVTSVTTARGSTSNSDDGAPISGAKVTVVFSEAMKGSTICASFTSAPASTSVTATITHTSGGNDRLSVGGCNVGVLDLGSDKFVSATVTYTASTLTWNGSTQLALTLGAPSPSNGVKKDSAASLTTSFAPSSSLTDVAGNVIEPGPYVSPAGKVFS